MPSYNLNSVLPSYGNRGRSINLAQHIYRYAVNWDAHDAIHGDVCWNAVIRCMREVNIISRHECERLQRETRHNNFQRLFPDHCPVIEDRGEFLAVPPGSLLGFFKFDRANEPFLAHAAIALGQGYVVGINGGSLGLPGHLASASMANYQWGHVPGASFVHVDDGHHVKVKVVYRDIDDFQSSCVVM